MGIYNFISNVGKKIFGDDEDNTQKKDSLHKAIQDLDLPAHVSIDVEGDKVTLEGNATSTEVKEKVVLALGNIDGVGTVEETITVAEESKESNFVTVDAGDTLWKIAQEVYGDGSKYTLIFEANKPLLNSADAIFPGQKLRIPEDVSAA